MGILIAAMLSAQVQGAAFAAENADPDRGDKTAFEVDLPEEENINYEINIPEEDAAVGLDSSPEEEASAGLDGSPEGDGSASMDGHTEEHTTDIDEGADGLKITQEDFYEDENQADGGIIPVVGFEIAEPNRSDVEEDLVGVGDLPESYFPNVDSVIGQQGSNNTCWAFAAMTCAERNLLEAKVTESLNLSEKHLLYGYFNREGDKGLPTANYTWYNTPGSCYMPVAAMAELIGAADENVYPYTSEAIEPYQYTDDIAHMEEALFLPSYPTDSSRWKGELWQEVTDGIKYAVMENGAVWISVNSQGKGGSSEWYMGWPTKTSGDGTVTYKSKPSPNHAVTIVGWDDAKVIPGAENPGAFYVQNTWSTNFGEGGYLWLSYEDASMSNPVTYRMEKSPLGEMRDRVVFSHTGAGWNGKELRLNASAFGVNVFTAEHDTVIDRVGFYTSGQWEYEVSLITDIPDASDPANGTVAAAALGTAAGAGFHKTDLSDAVEIRKGETFAVKAVFHNARKTSYYMPFEGSSTSIRQIVCAEGESYYYVPEQGLRLDCSRDEKVLANVNLGQNYKSPCLYAYGNVVHNMYITGDVTEAEVGETFSLAAFHGERGQEEAVTPVWSSLTDGVTVSENGTVEVEDGALTTAAEIRAEYDGTSAIYRFIVLANAAEADLAGMKMLRVPGSAFIAGSEFGGNLEGAGIITRAMEPDASLCYLFTKVDKDAYKIENLVTGYVLTADNDDIADSRYVSQQSWDGGKAQSWQILKADGGYLIRNLESGTYLNVSNFMNEIGDFIMAGYMNVQTAFRWDLVTGLADMKDAVMTVPVSAACTGQEVKPAVTLTCGSYTLKAGSDYRLSYTNNVKPGTATVTAVGIGGMQGNKTGTYVLVNAASSVISGKNYMIVPVKAPTRAVTVEKGSMLPKSRIYLSSQQGSEAQKFIFTKNSGGTYTLTDQKSDFVAGIRNNSTANASSLETQQDSGIELQRWNLKKQSDGSFSILNVKTGKAVYLVGGNTALGTYIAQSTYSGSINQRFYLVETSATAHTYSRTYTIRAAKKTSLALEISEASTLSGANARLYTYSGGASQKFRLMYSGGGYYRIVNVHSGKVLGIKDDSKANGTNVRQAAWKASSGQRWKIVQQSDGSVQLRSALGTALDIYAGTIKAKTNVDSWAVNSTAAQKWKLVKIS